MRNNFSSFKWAFAPNFAISFHLRLLSVTNKSITTHALMQSNFRFLQYIPYQGCCWYQKPTSSELLPSSQTSQHLQTLSVSTTAHMSSLSSLWENDSSPSQSHNHWGQTAQRHTDTVTQRDKQTHQIALLVFKQTLARHTFNAFAYHNATIVVHCVKNGMLLWQFHCNIVFVLKTNCCLCCEQQNEQINKWTVRGQFANTWKWPVITSHCLHQWTQTYGIILIYGHNTT